MEKLRAQGVADAVPILERDGYLDHLMAFVAFAGVVDEGVVCAAGMVPVHAPKVHALRCWAVTDPQLTSEHFLAMCLAIRRYFKRFDGSVAIETVVEQDNARGMRWVENILGFGSPIPHTAIRPDGSECQALVYERGGWIR